MELGVSGREEDKKEGEVITFAGGNGEEKRGDEEEEGEEGMEEGEKEGELTDLIRERGGGMEEEEEDKREGEGEDDKEDEGVRAERG